MACSFGYIAFFSLGLGPVPWLMMGEVFPGKIRSSASSLAAGLNWTCSFVTTETVRQGGAVGGAVGRATTRVNRMQGEPQRVGGYHGD